MSPKLRFKNVVETASLFLSVASKSQGLKPGFTQQWPECNTQLILKRSSAGFNLEFSFS